MTIEPMPGDWTDVVSILNKCKQPAKAISGKDSYLLVKVKNGTVIFRFRGMTLKEIDISTKSLDEVYKSLS